MTNEEIEEIEKLQRDLREGKDKVDPRCDGCIEIQNLELALACLKAVNLQVKESRNLLKKWMETSDLAKDITFAPIYRLTEYSLGIKSRICEWCSGTGKAGVGDICPECGGAGE